MQDFPTKTELIGQIAGSIKQVTTKLAVGVKQVRVQDEARDRKARTTPEPCKGVWKGCLQCCASEVPTKLAIGLKKTVEKGEEAGKRPGPGPTI